MFAPPSLPEIKVIFLCQSEDGSELNFQRLRLQVDSVFPPLIGGDVRQKTRSLRCQWRWEQLTSWNNVLCSRPLAKTYPLTINPPHLCTQATRDGNCFGLWPRLPQRSRQTEQKIWGEVKKKKAFHWEQHKGSKVEAFTFVSFKGAGKTHEPVTIAFYFYALAAYYVHASLRPSDSKLCAFRSKKVTRSSVQNRPLFKC